MVVEGWDDSLQRRHGNALPEWQEKRVLHLLDEGLEHTLIAERLGITERTVRRVMVRNGRPTGPSGLPLAETRVEEIMRLRAAGKSIRRIAELTGHDPSTVLKYIHVGRGVAMMNRRSGR